MVALRDQIAEWPIERRMLAGGALFVLLVALVFAIYLMFFRVQYDVLFADLRPADAAAIVAELDERGVAYRLGSGETSILVPVDQLSETRIAIAGSDLPIKGAVGFELFNESDMGLTEFAQKINYQRALQGELARTIMGMDEVESARVHLTIPERAIFRSEKSVPKAAVTIHKRVGRALDSTSVDGIQKLVASSVNDLQLADVSILDERGRVISKSAGSDDFVPPELAEKQAIEQYYRARIANALKESAPGQNMKVEVRATAMARDAFMPSDDEGVEQDLAQQAASERNFRLFIRLVSSVSPAEEETERLRRLVEETVGFNRDIGDRILFSNASGIVPATADPARSNADWNDASVPQRSSSDLAQTDGAPSQYGLLLAFGAAILILVTIILIRRKTRLSKEEHSSFASRLQSELAAEGSL